MAWEKGLVPIEEAFAAASVGFTDCKLHEWTPGNVLVSCPAPDSSPEALRYDWYMIGIDTPGRRTVIEFKRDEPVEKLEYAIRVALKAA